MPKIPKRKNSVSQYQSSKASKVIQKSISMLLTDQLVIADKTSELHGRCQVEPFPEDKLDILRATPDP